MHESKISANGQTTLPKAVREALGLKAGDKIRYFVRDGRVIMRAVHPIGRLSGIVSYDGPPVSLEEMDKAISEAASGYCDRAGY